MTGLRSILGVEHVLDTGDKRDEGVSPLFAANKRTEVRIGLEVSGQQFLADSSDQDVWVG